MCFNTSAELNFFRDYVVCVPREYDLIFHQRGGHPEPKFSMFFALSQNSRYFFFSFENNVVILKQNA